MKTKVEIVWRREDREFKKLENGGMSNLCKRDESGNFLYLTSSHMVEVEIDIQAIAKQLGIKALCSKGRKAREIDGLVTVRVIE